MTILLVAGLGRCGTSMTMQMMQAGGVPCFGRFPGFEPADLPFNRRVSRDFLDRLDGHAMKWLDPFRTPMPEVESVVVWLDRDPVQQAASQAKFVHLTAWTPKPDRATRRGFLAMIRRDRLRSFAMIGQRPTLICRFESILADPAGQALRITSWLEPWFDDLDHAAMAAAVRPRDARCAPSLDMEVQLIEAKHG